MRLRGRNVAGIGPLTSPMQPVAWSIYLTTADADETARKVREAGGTVVTEPFDIVDAGRMAVVVDPTGAAILAWQAGKHTGVQLANEANALVWSDLCTPDVEKARSFYRGPSGWSRSRSRAWTTPCSRQATARSAGCVLGATAA
jgi:uncharacterized protein